MWRRKPRTWAHLFAARVGVRRAARVISFVATYAAMQADPEWTGGDRPSMEEYADYWGISHKTAYRDLALFREAQPFFEHPAGWIASVGAQAAGPIPERYLGELS